MIISRHFSQIFSGNYDKSLERIHYLNLPFTARYVRFIPKEWNNRLSMRAGLLGCVHKGLFLCSDCSPSKQFNRSFLFHLGSCCLGYFRVQPETPCGKN